MYKRLVKFCEKNDGQLGFRSDRSTSHAIFYLLQTEFRMLLKIYFIPEAYSSGVGCIKLLTTV